MTLLFISLLRWTSPSYPVSRDSIISSIIINIIIIIICKSQGASRCSSLIVIRYLLVRPYEIYLLTRFCVEFACVNAVKITARFSTSFVSKVNLIKTPPGTGGCPNGQHQTETVSTCRAGFYSTFRAMVYWFLWLNGNRYPSLPYQKQLIARLVLYKGNVDVRGASTKLLDSGRRQQTIAVTVIILYADFIMRKLSGKCLLPHLFFILFPASYLPFRKSIQFLFYHLINNPL